MYNDSRRLRRNQVGRKAPTQGPTLGTIVLIGMILGVLFAAGPGCNCNNGGGGNIACASDGDCPNELVCDTAGSGVCVDPDSLNPYDCRPPLPGCACEGGDQPINCLVDGQSDDLVASCREGRSTCEGGTYGQCVLVPNPYCSNLGVGSGGFDPNSDNSSQVVPGPEGELLLDPDVKQVDFGYLWVANTGENTVSKLDIDTGREVARYAAVRDSDALGVPAVPSPGGFNGDEQNCGNCPSRTAIDFKGDAFVANRAFGNQGTVTKYANSVLDCVDHDGNGVIETSIDFNDDGVIDVNDPGEFLGERDECILWTAPVGNNDGVPRALAIDAGGPDGENGNIWVGLYNENRVIQISGDTGAPISLNGSPVSVTLAQNGGQMAPYGAAVDGGGQLWVTGLDDGDYTYLAKVNTYTAQLVQLYPIPDDDDGCSRGYGITIDVDQRIWLGGWSCRDVKGFDQTTEEWHRTDLDDYANTRGVAVDVSGSVWVAINDGRVGRLNMDDVVQLGNAAPIEIFDLPQLPDNGGVVQQTIGVGIDRNSACWVVSRNDASPVGTATRIDAAGIVESFPVGHRPYTYSDFTGYGLTTVVRPNGYWRGKIEGCATPDAITEWSSLEWTAIEPPGTSVRMRVRVADSVAELENAVWYGPFATSPVDLAAAGVPPSKFMEVEVQLSTEDTAVTPAFLGFSLGFTCPGGPIVE